MILRLEEMNTDILLCQKIRKQKKVEDVKNTQRNGLKEAPADQIRDNLNMKIIHDRNEL